MSDKHSTKIAARDISNDKTFQSLTLFIYFINKIITEFKVLTFVFNFSKDFISKYYSI